MYLYDLYIDRVINIEEKAKIVEEVISDLPEWFGVPKSLKEYAKEAKGLPLWVAKNDKEVIGFITLKESSKDTCEIHALGVKKAYHNEGIGKKLYYELEEYAKERYEYIQAKTMNEGYSKEYNKTIGFFKSLGFKELESFKTMWDEWNPVLVMVKKI